MTIMVFIGGIISAFGIGFIIGDVHGKKTIMDFIEMVRAYNRRSDV